MPQKSLPSTASATSPGVRRGRLPTRSPVEPLQAGPCPAPPGHARRDGKQVWKIFACPAIEDEYDRGWLTDLIAAEGGTLVEQLSPEITHLVVEENRDGPGAAERQVREWNQTRPASIAVLSCEQLRQQLPALTVANVRELILAGAEGQRRLRVRHPQFDEKFVISDWTSPDRRLDLGILQGLQFRDCDFSNAELVGTVQSMDRCNLRNSVWRSFEAYYIADCDLRGARLESGSSCFRTLRRSDCSDTDIRICHFPDGIASDSLAGTVFRRARFTKVIAHYTWATDVVFEATQWTKCHLWEAHFAGADFRDATLTACGFNGTDLSRADFRGTTLRDCIFVNANLTEARLEGADVSGCNFIFARTDGVDWTNVKGLDTALFDHPQTSCKAAARLDAYAAEARTIKTYARLLDGTAKVDVWIASPDFQVVASDVETTGVGAFVGRVKSFQEAFREAAAVLPRARLDVGSVEVSSMGSTLRGKALQRMVIGCWREAFGLAPVTDAQIAEIREESKRAIRQDAQECLDWLRDPSTHIKCYYRKYASERPNCEGTDCRGLELQLGGCPDDRKARPGLDGLNFRDAVFDDCDFCDVRVSAEAAPEAAIWSIYTRASFRNGRLVNCELRHGDFEKAGFEGAVLHRCDFTRACLVRCRFTGADLTGCDFTGANLRGADFTGATVTDVNWDRAIFDEDTRFPEEFSPPAGMVRHAPRAKKAVKATAKKMKRRR